MSNRRLYFVPWLILVVVFDTSGSSASNGGDNNLRTFARAFGDGNSTGKTAPAHAYIEAGVDAAPLTLAYADESESVSHKITVSGRPAPPVASLSVDRTKGAAPLTVNFDASGSTPPLRGNSALMRYDWDFGDGSGATGVTTSHTFSDTGSYRVTLTVTYKGKTDTATQEIKVNDPPPPPSEPPAPPVASFSVDQTEGTAPLTVNFDASASTPPPEGDSALMSYDWDFGEGNGASGVTTSHTFSDAGSYTVTLTLTYEGEIDTATQTITISEPPPAPPPAEGSLYLPETPTFDLDVAEAAINALSPGHGTAARPNPPEQPRGPFIEVSVDNRADLESYANAGGADITLTADIIGQSVNVHAATDVILRLNGHIIERLNLNYYRQPTAARRLKVIGPGAITEVNGTDWDDRPRPEDITFLGVWFTGAILDPPQQKGLGITAHRLAFLYCIGRGGYPGVNRGLWALFSTEAQNDPPPAEDLVFYGSNIAANNDFTADADNWAIRTAKHRRYWLVDTRLQADTYRQANRFHDLYDSAPGYTTPPNIGTPRQTTFVNTYHGHAMASIGSGPGDFNRGIFLKDIVIVSARRGDNPGVTLFGPHPLYDEGTWIIENMHVITDDGNIDREFIERKEAQADGSEYFDLDFNDGNTYLIDSEQVDPYAANENWPEVWVPAMDGQPAWFVGQNPFDTPPFLQ